MHCSTEPQFTDPCDLRGPLKAQAELRAVTVCRLQSSLFRALQPAEHSLPVSAAMETGQGDAPALQACFRAWQDNLEAAVWQYFDEAFDAFVR